MDIYEGYDYRINIVGADSTIIVDSNTGLVKASISDVDENIIVDIYTKTLYGTLVGNIINQDLELILDINNKELSVTSILAESYKGNIYNSQNSLVYDSIRNSITADTVVVKNLTSENIVANSYKGNIYNSQNSLVYDSIQDSITLDRIITKTLTSEDVVANTIISENVITKTLTIDTVVVKNLTSENIVANSYKGNIYNSQNSIVYDSIQNSVSLDGIVTKTLTSETIVANTINSENIVANSYKGNIYNSQNSMVYDSMQNSVSLDGIIAKTLFSNNIQADSFKGNIYNMHDAIVYDANHNSITINLVNTNMIAADSIVANSYKGNIYNMHNAVMYDSIQNNIVVGNIATNILTSDNIKTGDLSAVLINGNLVDHNKNLVLDTSGRTFHGRIFIDELSVGKEITASAIELYTGSGGINVYSHHDVTNNIENNFNSMTFSNARINNNQLDNTRPGDALSYFSTQGYYNNDYRDAGGFYFTADNDKEKYRNDMESIPAIFGVYVCNGTASPDDKEDILSKSFTYNSNGVLSSPIIKTGLHTNNIVNPEKGMIIFNDNIGKFQGYNGTSWIDLH